MVQFIAGLIQIINLKPKVVYTVVVGSYVCVLLGFPVEYSEFYISVTQENGAVIAPSDFFHIKRIFVDFSDLSRVSVHRAICFILAIVASIQIYIQTSWLEITVRFTIICSGFLRRSQLLSVALLYGSFVIRPSFLKIAYLSLLSQ